jgi:hypothetical protein
MFRPSHGAVRGSGKAIVLYVAISFISSLGGDHDEHTRSDEASFVARRFCASALILTRTMAVQGQFVCSPLVVTSTNSASGNAVVVFKLNTEGTPSLELAQMLTLASGYTNPASAVAA